MNCELQCGIGNYSFYFSVLSAESIAETKKTHKACKTWVAFTLRMCTSLNKHFNIYVYESMKSKKRNVHAKCLMLSTFRQIHEHFVWHMLLTYI